MVYSSGGSLHPLQHHPRDHLVLPLGDHLRSTQCDLDLRLATVVQGVLHTLARCRNDLQGADRFLLRPVLSLSCSRLLTYQRGCLDRYGGKARRHENLQLKSSNRLMLKGILVNFNTHLGIL